MERLTASSVRLLRKVWLVVGFLAALGSATALAVPSSSAELVGAETDYVCPVEANRTSDFLHVSSNGSSNTVTPNWDDDGGGGICYGQWTETRERRVKEWNGWYYATVVCGGVGGGLTYASGLVNPALGLTVAVVFGAGCTAMSMEAEYEWVWITEYRDCERYVKFDGTCGVGCGSWKRL